MCTGLTSSRKRDILHHQSTMAQYFMFHKEEFLPSTESRDCFHVTLTSYDENFQNMYSSKGF
jgi:hypothetical protein